MKKEENIVSKLVRGSQNLNRMKKEIHHVVSMILRGLESIGVDLFGPNQTYIYLPHLACFKGLVWSFKADRGMRKRKYDFKAYIGGLYFYIYSAGPDRMKAENIEHVYDSLPSLVEAMFEKVPELKEIAQPLLSAADKFTD